MHVKLKFRPGRGIGESTPGDDGGGDIDARVEPSEAVPKGDLDTEEGGVIKLPHNKVVAFFDRKRIFGIVPHGDSIA